jgi:hypothetical protein
MSEQDKEKFLDPPPVPEEVWLYLKELQDKLEKETGAYDTWT